MSSMLQKLMVRIGTDVSGTSTGLETVAKGMRRIQMSTLAVGAAVTGTAFVLKEMTEAGGRFINVQEAFNRQVGDGEEALAGLRAQTKGLITNYDLMTGYNKAVTLGAAKNTEEFGELAEVSIALGKALGIDVGHALESLNTGIARQSRLWLDNLGIIVSIADANEKYAAQIGKTAGELSDAQKKEAFRIEALRAAKDAMADLGEASVTAADETKRISVELKNLADVADRALAKSGAWQKFLRGLNTFVHEGIGGGDYSAEAFVDELRSLPDEVDVLQDKYDELFAKIVKVNAEAGDSDEGNWKLAGDIHDLAAGLDHLRGRIEGLKEASELVAPVLEDAFTPPPLPQTLANLDRLEAAIKKTAEEIAQTEFDLSFAKNAREADDLRVKLQELQGQMMATKRALDEFGDPAFFRAMEKARTLGVSGPIPLTFSVHGGGSSRHNGFQLAPVPSLGGGRIKVAAADATGALGLLKDAAGDVKDGFSDVVGSLFDAQQIGSNLASWGIGAVIGSVMGGMFDDSPMVKALEENREALKRNTTVLEQGIVASSPGSSITNALSAVLSTIEMSGGKGRAPSFYGKLLEDQLEELGLSMKDLEAVVGDLVPNIVSSWEGMLQLKEALERLSSADLVGTLGGQLSLLDREFALLDMNDAGPKIGAIMASLMGFVEGELAEALRDVDWTAPEEFINQLMADIRGGTFDLGELEGITPNEFLDVIMQLESFGDELSQANEELSQFGNSLRNAPTGFKVALARFESTNATPELVRTDPPGGEIHVVNHISIEGADKTPAELARVLGKELQRQQLRGGWGPFDLLKRSR